MLKERVRSLLRRMVVSHCPQGAAAAYLPEGGHSFVVRSQLNGEGRKHLLYRPLLIFHVLHRSWAYAGDVESREPSKS